MLFFVFNEEFFNDHIYETDSLNGMHGLCEGSIILQLHSSYLFGSLICFFNCFFLIIIIFRDSNRSILLKKYFCYKFFFLKPFCIIDTCICTKTVLHFFCNKGILFVGVKVKPFWLMGSSKSTHL